MSNPKRPWLDRRLDLPAYHARPLGVVFALPLGAVVIVIWLVMTAMARPGTEVAILSLVDLFPLVLVFYAIFALPIWAISHVLISRHPVAAALAGTPVGGGFAVVGLAPAYALLPLGLVCGFSFWLSTYRRAEPTVSPRVFE